MMLLRFAAKNVRHRALSYAAYFLSSAFAVWLFYSYATLIAHPQFRADGVGGSLVDTLMMIEWLVACFSVLFILYAHSAFFKIRQKELAVMALLGMTGRQMARTLNLENILVGFGAVAAGSGTAVVLEKLFFLAIGRALGLNSPLAFHLSLPASGLTVLIFAGVFGLVSLYTIWKVKHTTLADLIRAASRPKEPPGFAWWKVAICLLGLGTAYGLALTATSRTIEARIPVVLVCLVLSTYLLFSQSSTALLRWLQRQPRFYWRGANLITVSQLAYKVRDNARILFMVSMLTTMVLLVSGLFYSGIAMAEWSAEDQGPMELMTVGEPNGVGPERVRAVLKSHGVEVVGESHLPVLKGDIQASGHTYVGLNFAPVSEVNRWLAAFTDFPPVAVEPGHMAMLGEGLQTYPAVARPLFGFEPGGPAKPLGEPLQYDGRISVRAFHDHRMTHSIMVVSDETFAVLQAMEGAGQVVTVHGYKLGRWQESLAAARQLNIEMKDGGQLRATALIYQYLREDSIQMLFLAAFLGLLFFLATGNMLYFKLMTDLYEDRLQFQALYKLGAGAREVRQVVTAHTLVLFAAPMGVAMLHTAVAMSVFRAVLGIPSLWRPTLAVVLVYLILYGTYFLVTRRTYARAILPTA